MPRSKSIRGRCRLTETQRRIRDRNRMRRLRGDERYRSIERERDRVARRERRQDADYKRVERELQRVGQRKRRKDEGFRNMERVRITRQERKGDEEYMSTKRERARLAKRKRREDEEYRSVERERDRIARRRRREGNGSLGCGPEHEANQLIRQLAAMQDPETAMKQETVGETSVGVENEELGDGEGEGTYPRVEYELQIKLEI